MRKKKYLILVFILIIVSIAFAHTRDFYDRDIDYWTGDGYWDGTEIQPSESNEEYSYSFYLDVVAPHVEVEIYGPGMTSYKKDSYFVTQGSDMNIELGYQNQNHTCMIRVYCSKQSSGSAGSWSVFPSDQS